MAPTHECLHPDDGFGGQIDLRLVEELELLPLKREPQLVLYLDTLCHLASHDVVVELIRVPAAVLRFLRRDHDVLKQSVRVSTVAREERDPYAGRDVEGVPPPRATDPQEPHVSSSRLSGRRPIPARPATRRRIRRRPSALWCRPRARWAACLLYT